MTNEQIRQLTDTIYRMLFNGDGAALRIRLGLPPAAPDDITDDDLRDEMGILAIETLGSIEEELQRWFNAQPEFDWSFCRAMTRIVSLRHANHAKQLARWDGIDLLTGDKKDEKC